MPMRETASRSTRRTSTEGLRLGERLRQLRVAAGLTQTELAGERFSKEYVSQIERGKTRPTQGTIEWLADRLGVDAGFLARGGGDGARAPPRPTSAQRSKELSRAPRRCTRRSRTRTPLRRSSHWSLRPAQPACRSCRCV